MTDQIIQSNNSSVILRSLQEKSVQDNSYYTSPSQSILAKDYREIQSNQSISGAPASQEVAFNLTKSMLLKDVMIKTAFTTAVGADNDQYLGLDLFESIQIRSNNKVIFTFSGEYLRARAEQEGEATATGVYRRALPLVPVTEIVDLGNLTSQVTYTPVFCSFFEEVKMFLDLAFYEQIQVVCKFNTAAKMGLASPMLTASCTLWMWRYMPDPKAYDILRSKNQDPARPLTMLTYNTFKESKVLTSATENSIRLNVNYPVFNTYVMIKNITAAGKGDRFKIDSFDFEIAGTKLVENVPELVGKWESEKMGASKLITGPDSVGITRVDDSCVCLNWGLDTMDRTYNSGAVSFNQLNFPQVTVRHQSVTPANFELVVVHEYWQILTLSSANSSIEITSNS